MDDEKKEEGQGKETFKQFIENRADQTNSPVQDKDNFLADKVVSPEFIPPGAIPPRPFGTKNNQKLAADKAKAAQKDMGAELGFKFNNWADEKKKNRSAVKDSITPSQEKANVMLDSAKKGKSPDSSLTPNYAKVTEGKNSAPDIDSKKSNIDIEPE